MVRDNKIKLWNQIIKDSKKFGCYDRLTPHINALFKVTTKNLANLDVDTVLDVGAGDKQYKKYINCKKYISVDFFGDVDITADASNLPFKNNCFNMLICTQVLEHIKNPFVIMEEFRRVLKDGGIIFITVPTVMYLHEIPNDYYRYTKYGIEYILTKNYFSIEKSDNICSGFLVCTELFFISFYLSIYKLIRIQFVRKLLINIISILSLLFLRLDFAFFQTIFPGNILVIGYKKNDDSF